MEAPLPEAPSINWFEMEILYYLWEKERYGNEIRVLLNQHLGDNRVSTGKLYPVLKKLERSGYIRKLKKKTKEKIVDEEGVTSRLLTRGVDRVYFEITEDGRKSLDDAVSFSTAFLYNIKMEENHSRANRHVTDLLRSVGEDAHIGIIVPNTKRGILRSRSLIGDLGSQNIVYLLMPTRRSQDDPLKSDEVDFEFNSFPSKFEDIPLKAGYLDAVISLVHLDEVPSTKRFFRELVRIIRSKGLFITVDIKYIDSSILETILSDHVEYDGEHPFPGEDPEEIKSGLKSKLRRIKIHEFKELFVLHGYKPKMERN